MARHCFRLVASIRTVDSQEQRRDVPTVDGHNLNVGGSYRLNDAWRVGCGGRFLPARNSEAGHYNDSDYKTPTAYLGTAFCREYPAEPRMVADTWR